MQVDVLPDAEAVATVAADLISDLIAAQPRAVLGLPTGRTPRPTYARLARRSLDVAATTIVMLDEYVGLTGDDERSFRHDLRRHVLGPLGIPEERLVALDGAAPDLDAECRRFDHVVGQLGVDLVVLGIGRNGHIAFNEPGSPHDSRTRVVDLDDTTRRDNLEAFGSMDAVPAQAVTQGIGTILEADQIVLLATGEAKADAVAAMVDGRPTVTVPASALHRHTDVMVVVDQGAARGLRS